MTRSLMSPRSLALAAACAAPLVASPIQAQPAPGDLVRLFGALCVAGHGGSAPALAAARREGFTPTGAAQVASVVGQAHVEGAQIRIRAQGRRTTFLVTGVTTVSSVGPVTLCLVTERPVTTEARAAAVQALLAMPPLPHDPQANAVFAFVEHGDVRQSLTDMSQEQVQAAMTGRQVHLVVVDDPHDSLAYSTMRPLP
jgi:hypothetical protein